MALSEKDYEQSARELQCETAALKAVVDIESRGSGFLPDGRPKILFEAHIFSRFTKHKFDEDFPHISSPGWNRSLYKGGKGEWDRLAEAVNLDRRAALMACSWGLFQIMGFNFTLCGFTTIEAFVEAMKGGEDRHLDAFVAFIKTVHLDDELRRHDWAGFARGYNGPGFRANRYDTKLNLAYQKYSVQQEGNNGTPQNQIA